MSINNETRILLERVGFFRHVNKELVPDICECMDLTDPYSQETGRLYFVDAEDIYERGPQHFFGEVKGIFGNLGLVIEEYSEWTNSDRSFFINVNGVEVCVVSTSELSQDIDPWKVALYRVLQLTNSLLESVNSPELLYVEYSGNDSRVVVTNEEIQNCLTNNNGGLDSQIMLPHVHKAQ